MRVSRSVAWFVITAVILSLSAVGCGSPGRTGSIDYVVRMRDDVIGSETVLIEEGEEAITYSGTSSRPYLTFDTTIDTALTLLRDDMALSEYTGERAENEAVSHIYMSGSEGQYAYFRDEIQTFYYQVASVGYDLLPVEPGSVCTIQALIDWSLTTGERESRTWVVVPSLSMANREAIIRRQGEGRASIQIAQIGEYDVRFDEETWRIIEMIDETGGMTISRGRAGALVSKPYAPTKRQVKEVRVIMASGEELAGSLYVPKGEAPYPAAVLVGDRGPEDRTGKGLLSQVAERLADEGIAVLACDKRGVPESEGDYGAYTLDTAVDDLNSQLDFLFLRHDIDIEHVYVVGYGEGGVIAIEAAIDNPYVSACVLMATPSVRLFPDLPLRQLEEAERSGALSPEEVAIETNVVEEQTLILEQVQTDSAEISGREVFLGWMRSAMDTDQLDTVGSLDIPVLVLQGDRDTVVSPDQAQELYERLVSRDSGVQDIKVFEDLGHEFGPLVDEAESRPFRSHPDVGEEVLDAIADWLEER